MKKNFMTTSSSQSHGDKTNPQVVGEPSFPCPIPKIQTSASPEFLKHLLHVTSKKQAGRLGSHSETSYHRRGSRLANNSENASRMSSTQWSKAVFDHFGLLHTRTPRHHLNFCSSCSNSSKTSGSKYPPRQLGAMSAWDNFMEQLRIVQQQSNLFVQADNLKIRHQHSNDHHQIVRELALEKSDTCLSLTMTRNSTFERRISHAQESVDEVIEEECEESVTELTEEECSPESLLARKRWARIAQLIRELRYERHHNQSGDNQSVSGWTAFVKHVRAMSDIDQIREELYERYGVNLPDGCVSEFMASIRQPGAKPKPSKFVNSRTLRRRHLAQYANNFWLLKN